MPKLTKKLPSYRRHKATGRALVTLNGHDHYLGQYGSPESYESYKRLVAEWVTARREASERMIDEEVVRRDLRINELLDAYLRYAQSYYLKNGRPTGEVINIEHAVKPLAVLYGRSLVGKFGPTSLKTVRQAMIDEDLSRKVINARINRIRRVFKWGLENQIVDPIVLNALQSVAPLKKGRSSARENDPVKPVPEAYIKAALPRLSERLRKRCRGKT